MTSWWRFYVINAEFYVFIIKGHWWGHTEWKTICLLLFYWCTGYNRDNNWNITGKYGIVEDGMDSVWIFPIPRVVVLVGHTANFEVSVWILKNASIPFCCRWELIISKKYERYGLFSNSLYRIFTIIHSKISKM